MAIGKTPSILIIGGGTWGCSTALHLARRGYTRVTVLDSHAIPSPIAAGNDVNKIVELAPAHLQNGTSHPPSSVSDILRQAASVGWRKDPVFSPFFHETGLILAASSEEALKQIEDKEVAQLPDPSPVRLASPADFRKTMPSGVLTGDFPGWRGYYARKGAGWAHARKAMDAARAEAQRLGVVFIDGEDGRGRVVELLYGHEDQDVIGAKTADGCHHVADQTILAAGALSPQLVDLHNQLRATAWTLGHIAMTPAEAKQFRKLPVLFNIEKGFVMEPDEDRHELKVCDEHPGYCNWVHNANKPWPTSVPIAKNAIPAASERRIRAFLQDTMPQLAERPLAFARLGWCVDTPDRNFLITRHPTFHSLVLATGDSGHGYMHIPSIGGFIVDCLEGHLAKPLAQAWRWRPETADRFWGNDRLDRFGADNKVLDLHEAEVDGWCPGERA